MTTIPIRSLMTAIVQDQDSDLAIRALTQIGVPVIPLASSGGIPREAQHHPVDRAARTD